MDGRTALKLPKEVARSTLARARDPLLFVRLPLLESVNTEG
jgi:hypothetical protein